MLSLPVAFTFFCFFFSLMNTSPTLSHFFRRLAGGAGRAFVAGLLLLGPLGAAAQPSPLVQAFSNNPSNTTGLTFSPTVLVGGTGQTGYFTNAGVNAPTGTGAGAFGVGDGNASAATTTIQIDFDPQKFEPNSGTTAPNTFSFKLASFNFGGGGNRGFGTTSVVRVFLNTNNANPGFTAPAVLTINGTSSNGNNPEPNYAFIPGSGNVKTASFSTSTTATVTTDPSTYINTVQVLLPSSPTAKTTVAVRMVIAASQQNLLLIDDAALTSGNASPLPVSLTRFTAAAQEPGVRLAWATATEKNNDRFEVQRSADGAGFATIGTVRGQGSSVTPHAYAFVDAAPRPGLNYYRLRQVDFDGTASFSPVVSARGAAPAATAALGIYPNPSAGTLRLRGLPATDAPGRYRLLDLRGRVRGQGELAGPSLDVKGLPAGSYLLEVTTAQGVRRQRFTRE